MLAILQLVLKGGFRTSEFWVTLAGLAVTLVSPFVPGWVASLHAQQQSASPVSGFLMGLAAAVISGTYTIARMLTKGKAADAAAVIESAPAPDATITNPPPNASVIITPSGNVMTPGPVNEELHRQAVVAANNAVEVARHALELASNLPRPATFGAASSASASPATSASSSPGTSTGGV